MMRAPGIPTAWLFPGHGSQYVGMGQALLRKTRHGQAWLALAEQVSALPLGRLMEVGPASELVRPLILEPLLTAISCAYVDWLGEMQIRPAAVAGYSAGEVAAMYAAGIFDAETCLRVACMRGLSLQQTADAQQGGMMSLCGLPLTDLVALVEYVGASEEVAIAAYNGPRHLSVSGTRAALAQLAVAARALGATTSTLPVAGAWHTRLAASAVQQLHQQFAALAMSAPRMPVWFGSLGAASSDALQLRRALADSIAQPVYWHRLIDGLLDEQVEAFLEVGPGHVLCGLLSQMGLAPRIAYHFIERPGMTRLRYAAQPHHQPTRNP